MYNDEVIDIIAVINELNDFYHENGGNENECPFSLTVYGWFSTVSYWDDVIYRDYEDERNIIENDYESLKEFLVRKANEINTERNSVVWNLA